jgi:hypothetical protein
MYTKNAAYILLFHTYFEFSMRKVAFLSVFTNSFYIWLDTESIILKYGAEFSLFLILFLLLRNSIVLFRTSMCWRRVSADKLHVLKKLFLLKQIRILFYSF